MKYRYLLYALTLSLFATPALATNSLVQAPLPTVLSGGAGYTNGTQTLTISGGSCSVAPQVSVTVSGGAVTSVNSIVAVGTCTTVPASPAATTGGGGSGALFNVVFTSQASFVTPGTPLTMLSLATFLNQGLQAVASGNFGNVAPSPAFPGETWINTSAYPYAVSFTADGTHWVSPLAFDASGTYVSTTTLRVGSPNLTKVDLASSISGAGTIGTAAGSTIFPAETQYVSGSNVNRLQFAGYRRVSGSAWQGAGYRLQFSVDNTEGFSYIELGTDVANTSTGAIYLGTNNVGDALMVHASGGVSVGSLIDPGSGNVLVNGGLIGASLSSFNTLTLNGNNYLVLNDNTTNNGVLFEINSVVKGFVNATIPLTITNNTNADQPISPISGTTLSLLGADGANNFITLDSFGGINNLTGRRAGGTTASPAATPANTALITLGGSGYDVAWETGPAALMHLTSVNAHTTSDHSTYIDFWTTPPGSTAVTQRVYIGQGVAIGSAVDPGVGSLSVAGNFSLTQTSSGSVGSNFQPFTITFNDSLAAGSNFVYSGFVSEILNSSAITGTRPGFTMQTLFEAPTGNASGAFYVASSSPMIVGASDGGTSSVPHSYAYGSNPWCHFVSASATYWAGCIGSDVIAQIDAGSAERRIGVQIESDGAVHGLAIDAALDIFGTNFQWNTGILFDDSTGNLPVGGGTYPIASGGTLIKAAFSAASGVVLTAGLDLSEITGAWVENAIVLPANNGGISFGASKGGGEIRSSTTSNGGLLNFLNGEVSITTTQLYAAVSALTVGTASQAGTAMITAQGPIIAVGPGNGAFVEARDIGSSTVNMIMEANATSGVGYIGNTSNNPLQILINNVAVATWFQGLQVGAPTGGDKGTGTINVAFGVYLNGTGYTNPDYALEDYFTGRIVKFAQNPGAATYAGLLPLDALKGYMQEHYKLPGMERVAGRAVDIFERADIDLEKIEEMAIYITQLNDRINALAAANDNMRAALRTLRAARR